MSTSLLNIVGKLSEIYKKKKKKKKKNATDAWKEKKSGQNAIYWA